MEGDTKFLDYERDTKDVYINVTIERRGEHRVEVALEIWDEVKAEMDKMLLALKEQPNEEA